MNSAHNQILGSDGLRDVDGKVILAEENQGVVWAFDRGNPEEDPAVWPGQPTEGDQPLDWYREDHTLSRFLMGMLQEAVLPR